MVVLLLDWSLEQDWLLLWMCCWGQQDWQLLATGMVRVVVVMVVMGMERGSLLHHTLYQSLYHPYLLPDPLVGSHTAPCCRPGSHCSATVQI